MWKPNPSRRWRLRAKDLICTKHRRRLWLVGAGSLMDLNGSATMTALGRIRTEMESCWACRSLALDNKDAHA